MISRITISSMKLMAACNALYNCTALNPPFHLARNGLSCILLYTHLPFTPTLKHKITQRKFMCQTFMCLNIARAPTAKRMGVQILRFKCCERETFLCLQNFWTFYSKILDFNFTITNVITAQPLVYPMAKSISKLEILY